MHRCSGGADVQMCSGGADVQMCRHQRLSYGSFGTYIVVHLALTETRLTASTAPERVLQILQMVQGDVV